MFKPTHMYKTFDSKENAIKAYYGKLQVIHEYTDIMVQFMERPFKHPEKGLIYSFIQIGEPRIHSMNGRNPVKLKKSIKKMAKAEGVQIVRKEDIYSFQELAFHKVEMGSAKNGKPPIALYTEDLATCIGISMYNPDTHYNYLFHTPGCEEDTMPHIIEHLDNMVSIQDSNLEVNIASGIFALGDEEVIEIINKARDKLLKFFSLKGIEPKTHFAEKSGEVISYMSIDSNDGLVEIIREKCGY